MLIHTDKLRWLFWLRWKMFTRAFTRDTGRIIGLVLLVLFGLPFIGGIAIGSYFAYRYLPAPANIEFLFLVLTGIYLLWIALPLLEFTVNEGLDISKLALFPLTRAELMLSLLFSTLLDIPTVGLLLVFAAVVAGWALSLPLALLAALTMLIFYVQVIGISQLVLALFMRTLQSRRFRDLSIVLFAILSSSCYIFQQLIFRGLEISSPHFAEDVRHISVSGYLQWLPPGMAARAIQQAVVGNWGASFVWLAVLLVASILVLYLWQLVVARGLVSAESSGSSGSGRARRTHRQGVEARARTDTATAVHAQSRQGVALAQIFAISLKDIKYLRRDPQLLGTLFQSIMSIVVLLFVTVFSPSTSGRIVGAWTVLIAPAFVFLSLYTFSANMLGMERQSLTMLFLFPIAPERILWGKNLVVLVLGSVEMVVLVLLTAFASQAWNFVLPALAIGFSGLGVVLGCGNFSSIFLPQRMRQSRRGFQTTTNTSSEGGCLRAAISMLMLVVTILVLIPVGVAVILPLILRAQWTWAFSIPASLLYGVAFYFVVTTLVAPRMLNRTPEILAVAAKE